MKKKIYIVSNESIYGKLYIKIILVVLYNIIFSSVIIIKI